MGKRELPSIDRAPIYEYHLHLELRRSCILPVMKDLHAPMLFARLYMQAVTDDARLRICIVFLIRPKSQQTAICKKVNIDAQAICIGRAARQGLRMIYDLYRCNEST